MRYRPVLIRARVSVLNSVGRELRMATVGGGGRRRESIRWRRPFVAGFTLHGLVSIVYNKEKKGKKEHTISPVTTLPSLLCPSTTSSSPSASTLKSSLCASPSAPRTDWFKSVGTVPPPASSKSSTKTKPGETWYKTKALRSSFENEERFPGNSSNARSVGAKTV